MKIQLMNYEFKMNLKQIKDLFLKRKYNKILTTDNFGLTKIIHLSKIDNKFKLSIYEFNINNLLHTPICKIIDEYFLTSQDFTELKNNITDQINIKRKELIKTI